MLSKPKGFYQLREFYGILNPGRISFYLPKRSKIILRPPGKLGNHEISPPSRTVQGLRGGLANSGGCAIINKEPKGYNVTIGGEE
jgi:hypothetical protein